MSKSAVGALLLAVAIGTASGEVAPPLFTKKPAVEKKDDGVVITFAVDRKTDVAVFIEDAQGQIVRHLAAGVLGTNAPSPLKPGSLEQSLAWDGKTDYGRQVSGLTPYRVRVALGLGAKYDKVVVNSVNAASSIQCLAVGPDGTAYVQVGTGAYGWNGTQLLAFNRDGAYQRMITPFPASLTFDQVKLFGAFELEGRAAPLVHSVAGMNFYPMSGGPRKLLMAVTPGGHLLWLARHPTAQKRTLGVAAVTTNGAAVDPLVGPPVLAGADLADRSFVVAASDGKSAFISGLTMGGKSKVPAVCRVALPGRDGGRVFFGDVAQPGTDNAHLGGAPHGMAFDGKGRLFIADNENNRIVVVDEKNGAFVDALGLDAIPAVDTPVVPQKVPSGKKPKVVGASGPDCVAVDPVGGAIYLTRLTGGGNGELLKLAGLKDPRVLARLPVANHGNPDFPWLMAADFSAQPVVIWLASDYGKLLRLVDEGDKFSPQATVIDPENGTATFLDLSVDRMRNEVYARCGSHNGSTYWWYRFNEEQDKVTKVRVGPLGSSSGAQLVAGPDGSLYAPCYVDGIYKFDHEGKPSPWAKPRHDPAGVVKPPPHCTFAPVSECWTKHNIGIRPDDGHIFLLEPGHNGGRPPKMLREYLPTGELAREEPVIWKASDGAVGPKFDAQGNIYIAEVVKPVDAPYPPEFVKLFGPIGLGNTRQAGGGVQDNIANMYGSIVKFSPKGGMIHFNKGDHQENPFKGEPKLDPSLKTVDAAYYASEALRPVKVTGAEWIHPGYSHVEIRACTCESTRFDVDAFGRVFYPDLCRFRVNVLDTAGNEITRFGRYGNADSCGPEIAFAWLVGVGVTDRYAYMGDSLNRRMLRAKLAYAAEESAEIRAKISL